MSKAEKKTIELMKKAKDFIPDGGYSEKELNLAFFMFIKGYSQAEKDLELIWEDIELIVNIDQDTNNEESIIGVRKNEEHYQEVLKRFKDFKERKDGSKG